MCGAPLFARAHGDLTCVQHGHFVSAQVLDGTFGAGSAARVRQLVAKAPLTPRKCPDDRYEMSLLRNASGNVECDACLKCGAIWMPLSSVERAIANAPASDLSMSEKRSLYALGCVRSVVAPAASQQRTR